MLLLMLLMLLMMMMMTMSMTSVGSSVVYHVYCSLQAFDACFYFHL